MRTLFHTRAVIRAGLAAALATLVVWIEEGRALSGTDSTAGIGTTLAVALAAPLLVIVSANFPTGLVARVPYILRFALGVASAALLAIANQTLYPRLYPAAHLALAVAMICACVLAADGVLEAFANNEPVRVGGALGLGALSVFSLGATPAARVLTQSPATTRALHENSELLRPIVRLVAKVHRPSHEPVLPAPDPLEAPTVQGPVEAPQWSVLLITVDALRADHVSAYGYTRPTTPNIDALARAGAMFTSAYTSAPQTPYALSSIMTGTHIRAVRAAPPTWAEQFAERGYATAAFYPEAIFFTERARFETLEARRLGFQQATIDYATANTRAEQVSAFVDELPRDRSFFAWVHLFEPHEPYEGHAEFPFGASDVDRYDAEIAATDQGCGLLVGLVRARRPQTMVIITADHGEAFGEHASRFHGTTLYEEQVRVPLVIHAPGIVSPREVRRPVQTIDVYPTVARMVGIPVPSPIRGRDLFNVTEGVAFSSLADLESLAVGDERLICQASIGTCAVFDLARDPAQEHPVLSGPRVDLLRGMLGAVSAGNTKVSH